MVTIIKINNAENVCLYYGPKCKKCGAAKAWPKRGTQIELLKYLSYEMKFKYWTVYIIERDGLCLKELRLRRYKKIWSI